MDWPGEKLLLKIWETCVENGVGGLLRPWQMRREGIAAAEVKRIELIELAKAEKRVSEIRAGEIIPTSYKDNLLIEDDTSQTLRSTLSSQVGRELRRGLQVRRAITFAAEGAETASDDQISDDKVDPDWFARWQRGVEDISSADLQRLWGKILAGEVKRPGSYSMLTLELLERLGLKEALLIEKHARTAIEGKFALNLQEQQEKIVDVSHLTDIGFLSGYQGSAGLLYNPPDVSLERTKVLRVWDSAILITLKPEVSDFAVPVISFSRAGQEIVNLGIFLPSHEEIKGSGLSPGRI